METDHVPITKSPNCSICSGAGRRGLCGRCRTLVLALFVRAGDYWSGLQVFLDQIFTAAARALFGNRSVRRGEFALRIISAAVERVAFTRAFLHEFAIFALRTLHADKVLLHVLEI